MNIRDLRYFLAVVETGHFGRAAEKCHVSQPTLSGQIKKLEAQLEAPLFERTSRRVIVTETGTKIELLARRILRDVAEIEEIAVLSNNPLKGKFTLGAIPTLSPFIFPSLVQAVKDALPDLRLVLHEGITADLVEKLKFGAMDAILIALPVEEDLFLSRALFEDPFYLAVPPDHALAQHDVVDQEMLNGTNILLLEEGHCLRDQALEVCKLNYVAEEQDFKATSIETLRQMITAGTGITFMPKIAMRENEDGIRYIAVRPRPSRTIGIVWRKTTARQPVVDCIAELCSE